MNENSAEIRIYTPAFGRGGMQCDSSMPETDDDISVWEPASQRSKEQSSGSRNAQDHYT